LEEMTMKNKTKIDFTLSFLDWLRRKKNIVLAIPEVLDDEDLRHSWSSPPSLYDCKSYDGNWRELVDEFIERGWKKK